MTNPFAVSQDNIHKMEEKKTFRFYQINGNKLKQYHNLKRWTSICKKIQSIKKKIYKQEV